MRALAFAYNDKERGMSKRHVICWGAFLEVIFPDFHDQINVKIINFSAGGALLHSEYITVDGRHLVVSDIKPELKLKISLPDATVLELTTRIVWYKVLSEKSIFEIGISFMNFKKEANISIDRLMKVMRESE